MRNGQSPWESKETSFKRHWFHYSALYQYIGYVYLKLSTNPLGEPSTSLLVFKLELSILKKQGNTLLQTTESLLEQWALNVEEYTLFVILQTTQKCSSTSQLFVLCFKVLPSSYLFLCWSLLIYLQHLLFVPRTKKSTCTHSHQNSLVSSLCVPRMK